MSNHWMGRLGFSTSSHREHFDDRDGSPDPTPSTTWPNIDGGAYMTAPPAAARARSDLLLPKGTQFSGSGVYQFPHQINVAGSIVAREGFGQPFWPPSNRPIRRLPEKRVLLSDSDENRLPGVFHARPAGREGVHVRRVAADADARHVQRDELVDDPRPSSTRPPRATTGFYNTLEIMNPRLIRLGVGFSSERGVSSRGSVSISLFVSRGPTPAAAWGPTPTRCQRLAALGAGG